MYLQALFRIFANMEIEVLFVSIMRLVRKRKIQTRNSLSVSTVAFGLWINSMKKHIGMLSFDKSKYSIL